MAIHDVTIDLDVQAADGGLSVSGRLGYRLHERATWRIVRHFSASAATDGVKRRDAVQALIRAACMCVYDILDPYGRRVAMQTLEDAYQLVHVVLADRLHAWARQEPEPHQGRDERGNPYLSPRGRDQYAKVAERLPIPEHEDDAARALLERAYGRE